MPIIQRLSRLLQEAVQHVHARSVLRSVPRQVLPPDRQIPYLHVGTSRRFYDPGQRAPCADSLYLLGSPRRQHRTLHSAACMSCGQRFTTHTHTCMHIHPRACMHSHASHTPMHAIAHACNSMQLHIHTLTTDCCIMLVTTGTCRCTLSPRL